ncbi:MAG: DUF535 family protein [Steroidobacteraceae bacterium]
MMISGIDKTDIMQRPALSAPWPKYATLLAVDKTRILNIGRRLRLAWAIWRTQRFRTAVDETVAQCPWVRQTMNNHPILFRPLTSDFLDSRLTRQTLFEWYAHDLEFTSTRIHGAIPSFFPLRLHARLSENSLRRYAVDVDMNLDHPQEGLWRLSLRCPDHSRLFTICFSIIPGPTIFIGAVQGGRSTEASNIPERIRLATKDFDGVRPHFLLFDVVRALAVVWRVEAICGVSNQHQLKAHSSSKHANAVRFSYDAFFQELGARSTCDGNWDVPTTACDRKIADAPSKKRAMYRRRIALLNELRSEVTASLEEPFVDCVGIAPAKRLPYV